MSTNQSQHLKFRVLTLFLLFYCNLIIADTTSIDISDRVRVTLINNNNPTVGPHQELLIQLTNISDTPIIGPISLVLNDFENSTKSALNADGLMQDLKPYYDVTLNNMLLMPGEISHTVSIQLGKPYKQKKYTKKRQYNIATLKKISPKAISQKLPFTFIVTATLPAKPLRPRSYPYILESNSGIVDITFKVNAIHQYRQQPLAISLKQITSKTQNSKKTSATKITLNKPRSPRRQYTNKAQNNKNNISNGIFTGTAQINTDEYQIGDCFEYQAIMEFDVLKLESEPYSLCISGLPTKIAESDTRPENLLDIVDGPKLVANEVLVRVVHSTSEAEILSIAQAIGGEIVGSVYVRRLYQLRFSDALSIDELNHIIDYLNADPRVESAYPNIVGKFSFTPNDPEFSNQAGLRRIRADDAWDINAYGDGVIVTVVDTGIMQSHTEFFDGTCKVVGGCIGNSDWDGHGTAVAGIITATVDNGIGIAGIASQSMVESLIVSSDPSISIAEMVSAFQAVASSGLGNVVNASFSIPSAPPPIDFPVLDQWDLCAAINDVVLNDSTPVAIVVTAAGNDGNDGNHYPAKCNDTAAPADAMLTRKDLLITVMASGSTDDTLAAYSNYGDWVDLAAPGTNVISTYNDGTYITDSGTSFSTPMVSAAAAQLLSCGVAVDEIESVLKNSATVHIDYPIVNPVGSAPRIDVYEALRSINQVPSGITLSNNDAINENTDTSSGITIGTLSTDDNDICDQYRYNIQPSADAAAFSIGGENSNILILHDGVLDFETQSNYIVIVRTTDWNGEIFDQSFTININDLNESPTISDQTFNIDENSNNGTIVGFVSASDPDSGDTLRFSILNGNTNNAFSINSSTGQISVNNDSAINFETNPTFSLTIQVTDFGLLSGSATITIDVEDLNEPPTISDQTFSIIENAVNGTLVGTVLAGDPDDGDTLNYEIIGGNSNSAFSINSNNGQISVNNSSAIDFESITTFNLSVKTSDSTSLHDTGTVSIEINNLNEPPTINDQIFNINENIDNGTPIGSVLANDPDNGDTLSFEIIAGNLNNAFSINNNNGQISVNNSSAIDFESITTFNLSIKASDSTSLHDTGTVSIEINNLNEPPTINDQIFNINENIDNGTAIGSVLANDPDNGDTLSFEIIAGNLNNAFSINNNNGQILVNNSSAIDFEALTAFTLSIEISDSATLSDTGTVTVEISNLNEPPTINDQIFNINENIDNGTAIGSVLANDPDNGDTLSFEIIAGNLNNAFSINNNNGQILVNNSSAIDFEALTAFTLSIEISDSATLSDTGTVTVEISNLNEPPTISNQTFNINENSSNASVVGSVFASDPDNGDTLSYTITAGNTDSAFIINSGNGELSVNNSLALDFETTPVFNLTIEVSDTGTLTSNASITININDINEDNNDQNQPPIINDQFFNLDENPLDNTVVGTVIALDDSDNLVFTILSGNSDNAFIIDDYNGELIVHNSNAIDFESTPSFNLTIQVTDSAGLNDTATVTIELNDLDENSNTNDSSDPSTDETGSNSTTSITSGNNISNSTSNDGSGGGGVLNLLFLLILLLRNLCSAYKIPATLQARLHFLK